jgi:outer membrane receptor protein involved in Fe transport
MNKHTTLKKKLLVTLIKTAIVTAAVGPAVSWAQSSDAGLRGKAPANSEITAKNVATGLTRRTKAAADGSYAIVALPPGTYTVDAGPGTAKTVTLVVASTGTLDLTASAAASSSASTLEGISVTATVLQEVKTSEIGNTISLHQINTIPQISRNFLEFADTVPGMVFSVDSSGNTSLRGGAQTTSSTNVYIDGVGQKSYVKEGGITGQNGSQGNPFPQLAIGEYKVITSNYKAEYDQVSSAAVIAQTKSGTNEFHGEVFGDYTSDEYRSETPSEQAAGHKTQSHEKEYGFAIGGPIIQDTMHFFFTYEEKNFDQPVVVVPGVLGINNLLPASAAAQLGTVGLPFTEDLYFGKIDWEFSDHDRIELSSKVRKENANGGYGAGSTAQSAGYITQNNDTRIDLRWEHNADNWTNEALLTYEKAFNNPIGVPGNGQVYTYGPELDATILTAGAASPLATQNKGQKGPAFQDDLTFSNFNWYGDHTIKMGFKFKQVTLSAQDSGDSSAQFYYDVEPGTGTAALPYKVFFAAPAVGTSPLVTSKDKQYGTYIQDDWAVNDKLTLNLGVRWDYEVNPSYLNYVTPASVVAAYNSQDPNAPAGQTYAQSLAKGGVNINDYISTGHNRSAFKDEWQPRLGFSYDLNGDEEHVVIGGIGRSYDRDLYDYLQLEQTKYSLSQYTYYFDTGSGCYKGGSPCIPYDPKYLTGGIGTLQSLVTASTAGKEIDAMNNNLKAPYSDQISLGMRNKLGDWNTSAVVAHVESKDGFAFTLGNRYPNGAFWQNGSQPWGNGVPGFGSLIIGNNAIETRTTSLLLSAEKPYTKESGWAATIAYTYSDAKQNRDINEHYSFDQETLAQYPFITSNAVAKHRLVATGSIDGPWGITYSGKLTLATPLPVNGFLFYNYPATAPNGAANLPMAGTPRGQSFLFGGPIFGYRDIDVSASKDFDLTRGIDLILRLDVLNVGNYKNLVDESYNFSSPVPVVYNSTGNITGVPRTFKFSMRVTW